MKILLGGSPCTHWSIAQKKDREVEPKGLGWELFKNYLISLEKFKPNFFLYENNKSMAPAIREQITQELGVEPILINSALVSAQNRQRLYWTNIPEVEQPQDLGILLQDILESGVPVRKKAYTLKANYGKGVQLDQFLDAGHFPVNGVAKPICLNPITNGKSRTVDAHIAKLENNLIPRMNNENPAKQQYDCIAQKVLEMPLGCKVDGGKVSIKGKVYSVNLSDGFYIFRKLSVRECMTLQTVPKEYIFPVSKFQAYKMLGNGWTVDVIAHILSFCPGIMEKPLEVLSMYDGMSCGRLALNKLGASVAAYWATEIDKYAIQTTQTNFPDTVHLGDAFQVRKSNWRIDL